eukprot:gene27327-47699_t
MPPRLPCPTGERCVAVSAAGCPAPGARVSVRCARCADGRCELGRSADAVPVVAGWGAGAGDMAGGHLDRELRKVLTAGCGVGVGACMAWPGGGVWCRYARAAGTAAVHGNAYPNPFCAEDALRYVRHVSDAYGPPAPPDGAVGEEEDDDSSSGGAAAAVCVLLLGALLAALAVSAWRRRERQRRVDPEHQQQQPARGDEVREAPPPRGVGSPAPGRCSVLHPCACVGRCSVVLSLFCAAAPYGGGRRHEGGQEERGSHGEVSEVARSGGAATVRFADPAAAAAAAAPLATLYGVAAPAGGGADVSPISPGRGSQSAAAPPSDAGASGRTVWRWSRPARGAPGAGRQQQQGGAFAMLVWLPFAPGRDKDPTRGLWEATRSYTSSPACGSGA